MLLHPVRASVETRPRQETNFEMRDMACGTPLRFNQADGRAGRRVSSWRKSSVTEVIGTGQLHYCSSEIATLVIAVTPVRMVGSGSGSKWLVCGPGSSFPAACAAANFNGSIAPRMK